MRRRVALLCLLLCTGMLAMAQSVRFGRSEMVVPVGEHAFAQESVRVEGQGREIYGIDLLGRGARHQVGDLLQAAERSLPDTTWPELRHDLERRVPDQGLHWVRIQVLPDASVRDQVLRLSLASAYPATVYLNGAVLVPRWKPVVPPGDSSIAPVQVPLSLAVDGPPEVFALCVEGPPGSAFTDLDVRFSLHPADVHFAVQRSMVHYGVFAGINVIIVLLALVIGRSDRQRGSWRMLALLAAVGVVGIVTHVGGANAMLGFPEPAARVLRALDILLTPWPSYLLLVILGTMGAGLTRPRKRLYTVAAVIFTGVMGAFLVAELNGWVDTGNGLVIEDGRWHILVPGLLLILLFAVIITWFSFDVLRMGIRLFRRRGNTRWIGAGAVAGGLVALLLRVVGASVGLGERSWTALLADYCAYVAVPVGVAVYMAIRSAHHNRLVARQRDELDEEVKERTAELRAERDRSEELLLNILPAEVAEELKVNGTAAPRHYDRVTVLFTDFKGFTDLAVKVPPTELVAELNTCFAAFDTIIGAHGIEKIKTIGDAFMCAGGLPDPQSASALDVVMAALEMQAFMEQRRAQRRAEGHPAFDMRLGIHSGPVVAGIVGVKKFQYDIWGDTVNTASRMESNGEVGQVNISSNTYELLKNEPGLTFIPRGFIEVKGKGQLEMYFVTRA